MLTQQEKDKFLIWLDSQIKSNEPLIEQIGKVPGTEAVLREYQQTNAALKRVIRILVDTEVQSIGG